ncbi:MAG: hypothetical protein PHF63_00850 [Herbinix sp.]|nr:hypothetical protein [Herbinix sp.]
MMELYEIFKSKSGKIISQAEIDSLFKETTGYRPRDDKERYNRFVKQLLDSKAIVPYRPTYKELVNNKRKYLAIQMYSFEHKCGITEARKILMNQFPNEF